MSEPNRSAHHTIAGYYYQFDHSISQLLDIAANGQIVLEGIEDVDVYNADSTTAIQVKYYQNTNYSKDLVREPILLMLKDFSKRRTEGANLISYTLYIHFNDGWESFETILTAIADQDNCFVISGAC